MSVLVKEVENRNDLRKFIHFPASIHLEHDAWIPPVYVDEWNFFNPKKNTEFAHSETILLLALNGGKGIDVLMAVKMF